MLREGEDLRSRGIVLARRATGGKGNSVEKKKEEEEEEDDLKLHRR